VIISIAFFIMLAVIAIGIPIARAFGRRMDRQQVDAKPSPDVTNRLERIEHAVEAIAIEVERISEGQRFTTRLMSETSRALGADVRALPQPNPFEAMSQRDNAPVATPVGVERDPKRGA
jgi:hypothetical protein